MIDRDRPRRVGQLVCQPGDRVGIELGFLWDSEPRMVVARFRRFVGTRFSARRDLGEQISLEGGEVRRVVEGSSTNSRPNRTSMDAQRDAILPLPLLGGCPPGFVGL